LHHSRVAESRHQPAAKAVLAYVLGSPEIWERELKAFFSEVFSEGAPTQFASIEPYQPGRIPVVFVHGTASSAGRWGDMVNDLMDDPRICDRYQFWFFTYDTGNPVLYSALLLREALRDATPHRGSYLTEYPLAELVGRFLTLPVRFVQTAADLARSVSDFKIDPGNLVRIACSG
jgi:hypothetical protein